MWKFILKTWLWSLFHYTVNMHKKVRDNKKFLKVILPIVDERWYEMIKWCDGMKWKICMKRHYFYRQSALIQWHSLLLWNLWMKFFFIYRARTWSSDVCNGIWCKKVVKFCNWIKIHFDGTFWHQQNTIFVNKFVIKSHKFVIKELPSQLIRPENQLILGNSLTTKNNQLRTVNISNDIFFVTHLIFFCTH